MTRLVTAAAIATMIASPLLGACEKNKAEPKPRLRAVRYMNVSPSGGVRTIRVNGKSAAGTESILSFRVSGTVKKLHVKVGQDVKKNDLLIELDASDYQLQLQQANASVASASAQYRNAQKNHERLRSLWVQGAAKDVDVEAALTQKQVAGASAAAAAKAAQLARQRVKYTKIFSPVDGKVAATPVKDNATTQQGKPAVVLTSGDRAKVNTSLPTKYINDVKNGDIIKVRFDELPNKTFEAEVSEIGVTSTQSSTFAVVALLKPADKNVRADYNADVEFTVGKKSDKIRYIVPTVAVKEDREGRYIYLLKTTGKDTGTVHRKKVETGEITTEGLEVLSGVTTGDLLVTAGIHRLNDGMKVRVVDTWKQGAKGGDVKLPTKTVPAKKKPAKAPANKPTEPKKPAPTKKATK